jgi:pseudaminic acid synthase
MFKIGNRSIDNSSSAYIIAELSANHNGSLDVALQTIKAAKATGADAIKVQTYTADTITIDVRNDYFKIGEGTIWDGKYLYDLYKEAYTPWEWHDALQKAALAEGLDFFSSPFDFTAADFLEKMNVPVYKIASFEIFDLPLIEYVAKKGKPIIISTGMATFEDIQEAVDICKGVGNNQIALLKCTSAYPAPPENANLLTIKDLEIKFGVVSGLSDHTLGITVPVAAVALGAKIIEKHFILDKNMEGPDSSFSLDPAEFKQMVDAVRDCEKAIGKVTYELSAQVQKNKKFARSLFVIEDMKKDEVLTPENIKSIRPGYGMPPKFYYKVLGKKIKYDVKKGTPLTNDMLD